jgi:hypothetical protein
MGILDCWRYLFPGSLGAWNWYLARGVVMNEHYDWSMAILEVKTNINKLNHALLMGNQDEAKEAASTIIDSMRVLLESL